MRHLLRLRPKETEADLIAAAAPIGLVTTRHLVQLVDDHPEGCSWCSHGNIAWSPDAASPNSRYADLGPDDDPF